MSTGIFKEIFGSFRYKISTFFAGFFAYNLFTFAYVMKHLFINLFIKFTNFVFLFFWYTLVYTALLSRNLSLLENQLTCTIQAVTWPRDVIIAEINGTNSTTIQLKVRIPTCTKNYKGFL